MELIIGAQVLGVRFWGIQLRVQDSGKSVWGSELFGSGLGNMA